MTLTAEQNRNRQRMAHKNRRRYSAGLARFGDGSTRVSVDFQVPGTLNYGTVHEWPREKATRKATASGIDLIVPSVTQCAQLAPARLYAKRLQAWEDAAHPEPAPIPCHYCGHPDPYSLPHTCC